MMPVARFEATHSTVSKTDCMLNIHLLRNGSEIQGVGNLGNPQPRAPTPLKNWQQY